MSIVIPLLFDTGRKLGLWVAFDERAWLLGGAGVHRFTVGMRIDSRNTLPVGTSVALGGTAWLVTSTSRDYLGRWTTEKPFAVYAEPFSSNLVLEMRDDQLALIEQRRAAADGSVRLDLEFAATLTGGLPADEPSPPRRGRRNNALASTAGGWPVAHGTHTLTYTASQWAELLAGLTAHTSLAVVMPVPLLDPSAHEVAKLLRDAVKLITDGQPAKAVVDARRAIEVADTVFGDLQANNAAMKAITDIAPNDRTQDQRFALLRHALFSLASPPAHGDAKANQFVWSREAAVAVISSVAALAAVRSDASSATKQP
ncbi:hypothetical protein ACIBSW_00875 [Actinoplanes sp. NPDC049668]|uniref:hypothetical protein n=1 Tax=unclassified Actinoplanes TaxID=2626549 RepID=UPI0033A5F036